MKKLYNYGTFNNNLYKVDIRDENNLNKSLKKNMLMQIDY